MNRVIMKILGIVPRDDVEEACWLELVSEADVRAM